jgi:hypothetical protein
MTNTYAVTRVEGTSCHLTQNWATEQSDAEGLGFAARLQIARRLATTLQAPADSLNSADFFDRVARMDVMMKYMISHWEEDPADLEDSRGFGDGFLSLLDSTADGEQGVRE